MNLHNLSVFAAGASFSFFLSIVICQIQVHTKCRFSSAEEKLLWPRWELGLCIKYCFSLACPSARKKYHFSQIVISLLHDSLWPLHLPPSEQPLKLCDMLSMCCRFTFASTKWKGFKHLEKRKFHDGLWEIKNVFCSCFSWSVWS